MRRLIDADVLMKAMYHRAFETDGDTMWQSGCWVRYRAIEQVVKDQPTIEERETGEWIREPGHIPKCSICGFYSDDADRGYDKSCPNCGTDMRGEQK